MSTYQAETAPAGTEDLAPPLDPALMALVGMVNESEDAELGVTLHVSGLVVSGILIPQASYWKELGQFLRESGGEALAPAVEWLASGQFTDLLPEDTASPDAPENAGGSGTAAEDPGDSLPRFIHLRNAAVYTPGGGRFPETYWRGRLSHVSGWSLGNLRQSP